MATGILLTFYVGTCGIFFLKKPFIANIQKVSRKFRKRIVKWEEKSKAAKFVKSPSI